MIEISKQRFTWLDAALPLGRRWSRTTTATIALPHRVLLTLHTCRAANHTFQSNSGWVGGWVGGWTTLTVQRLVDHSLNAATRLRILRTHDY